MTSDFNIYLTFFSRFNIKIKNIRGIKTTILVVQVTQMFCLVLSIKFKFSLNNFNFASMSTYFHKYSSYLKGLCRPFDAFHCECIAYM